MMKVYEVPRKSVIKYQSSTYEAVYFFEGLDGSYGHARSTDGQRIYLRPLDEVEVVSSVMTYDEFLTNYKGK